MTLHYNMVSAELKRALIQLMGIKELKNFRLVGGTGLALQLGHRSSIDIDLFAGGGSPAPNVLAEILRTNFSTGLQITRLQQYGLAASINNVKVDLYDWKVPFSTEPNVVDGIRMATIEDIFAFKCEALQGRRAEKDFSDMAEIMQHVPLEKLFHTFSVRYPHFSKSAIVAILLKPESFERDKSINYAAGKSWEEYCLSLIQSIKQFETKLMNDKRTDFELREIKIYWCPSKTTITQ